MGLMQTCSSCGNYCEHNVLQRTDLGDYESIMTECKYCGATETGTYRKQESMSITECPRCGSSDTAIDEGPWIYDDCMKFNQTCYNCGHLWTGVYKLPERIGVEDESNFLEDDDEMSEMRQ